MNQYIASVHRKNGDRKNIINEISIKRIFAISVKPSIPHAIAVHGDRKTTVTTLH